MSQDMISKSEKGRLRVTYGKLLIETSDKANVLYKK